MAIGVVIDFAGGTLDQYDQVNEVMGIEAGAPLPDGLIFHWATATDDGIRVTDVWESREAFERFMAERAVPATQQAGMEAPPQVTFHEVHNRLGR